MRTEGVGANGELGAPFDVDAGEPGLLVLPNAFAICSLSEGAHAETFVGTVVGAGTTAKGVLGATPTTLDVTTPPPA